jgi:NADH-quinone oxidoreductase subunit H
MAWLIFLLGLFVTGVTIGVVNALFARFRIDQAVRWLFIFSTALSLIALLWAFIGRGFL